MNPFPAAPVGNKKSTFFQYTISLQAESILLSMNILFSFHTLSHVFVVREIDCEDNIVKLMVVDVVAILDVF